MSKESTKLKEPLRTPVVMTSKVLVAFPPLSEHATAESDIQPVTSHAERPPAAWPECRLVPRLPPRSVILADPVATAFAFDKDRTYVASWDITCVNDLALIPADTMI